MEVKKAKLEDLAEILSLQKLCYAENAARYNNFNITPLTQIHAELVEEFARGVVLKVIAESDIVGSIRAYENKGTCYIGKLIVHPEYQNRGIGKTLLLAVEQYFYDVKYFELFTGFRDENNLYLYKKLGFKEFKTEFSDKDFSFVFLQKRNNHSSF